MTDANDKRLVLVTPPECTASGFADTLAAVLDGAALSAPGEKPVRSRQAHPVAAVIITSSGNDRTDGEAARSLVPAIQYHGVAAILASDTRIAGRAGADGVHCDLGLEDLKTAIATFRPDRIVGAGNLKSRHATLLAAELEPDYLYFGMIGADTRPDPHPAAMALASWAAEMLTIPVVAQAGCELASIAAAAATGADHVALGRAIWDHDAGPVAAIKDAMERLDASRVGRTEADRGEPRR